MPDLNAMGGLNTSLLIGVEALGVNQDALDTTSNNIANADTSGYTREVAEISETAQNLSGGTVTGGGVTLAAVQSIRDELLNLQIQQQTSAQSGEDTQSSALDEIQTYFSSSGNDIASAFSSFSSSLDALSSDPSSSSVQASVLSAGENLAKAFNTTSNGLTTVQSEMNTQVTQTVAQINTLSAQIAQLNGQISQSTTGGQDGGTTEDQRDELVQQLSKLIGISVTQSNDGEVITTGNGAQLVMGNQSDSLQTTTGSDGMQHVLDSNGNDITTSIQGGTLGGAIAIRDTVIPGYLSQLNSLASEFTTAFNTAQAEGYDANGNAGQDFFSVPSDSSTAAAAMSVAITDASQVAMSSDGASGSNGNVANLSAALTDALPSGQSASETYANLVYQVGNDASNASTQSTAIGDSLTQLNDQLNSASGVSIDEETTNLIRYQTAYEAAARIVSTIQALDSVTISMVST
ncbi:MAG: flagellar hook-associated protein FlgK [Terracidiphilus sp.]